MKIFKCVIIGLILLQLSFPLISASNSLLNCLGFGILIVYCYLSYIYFNKIKKS